MFGWIDRVYHGVTGVPKHVIAALHAVEHAIVGWVANIFHLVGAGWLVLHAGVVHWARSTSHYLDEIGALAVRIVKVYIPTLTRLLAHDIAVVGADIANLAKESARWVATETARAEHALLSALRWVETTLVAPVARDVAGLLSWFHHVAFDAVDLVTHPDRLVTYLARYLWHTWVSIVEHYARDVWRWTTRNGAGFTVSLARTVEHALADIL